MTNVNENTINKDFEEAREIVKEVREIVKEVREIVKEVDEDDQETNFLNTKKDYENITLLVKLAFHNYFSNFKGEKYRECDVEEFLKSEKTEEFQNQKMRLKNSLKEDLFTSSYDEYYYFVLKSIRIYGWKLMGLFK